MSSSSFHILLIDESSQFNQKLHSIIGDNSAIFGNYQPKITCRHDEDAALLFLDQNAQNHVNLIMLGRLSEQKYIHFIATLKKNHADIPIAVFFDNDSEKLVNALVQKDVISISHKNELNLHTLSRLIVLAIAIHQLDFPQQSIATPTTNHSNTEESKIPDSIFRDIINKSSEIIIVTNQFNSILFANQASQEIFGKKPASLLGQPLNIIIKKLDSKDFESHPRTITASFLRTMHQIGITMEMTLAMADGSSKDFELRISSLPIENTQEFLLNFRDITNLKRVIKLTSEINEKARIDKLKDEFISIVSHEMRTPLTIVKGAVTNLRDGIVGGLSAPQNKILDTTIRNVDRLARIINDLLDLSRLESGKAKIEKKRLNLMSLIKEIVVNFKPICSEKNIDISIESGDITPSVFADADMITQVLTNLIQNATRYAKSQITVQIIHENFAAKSDDPNHTPSMIRVGIIDDGPGIPKEKLDALFDKFEQLDRPQGGSGYKGTGLGLAICRQIVNLHHGRIWTVSSLGNGAQFYFLLPTYQENDNFVVALDSIIRQAEKSHTTIGVLILKPENLSAMVSIFSEKDLATLFNSFTSEVRNKALRKTDFLHFRRDTRESIIILTETNQDSITKIIERIQIIAKNTFCKNSDNELSCRQLAGLAVYPTDSSYSSELLKLAYQNLK